MAKKRIELSDVAECLQKVTDNTVALGKMQSGEATSDEVACWMSYRAQCAADAAANGRASKVGLKAEIKDGELIIRLPVNAEPEASSTGKTLVVASSHGNQKTEIMVNGKAVMVGVNAYIKV